MRRFELLLWAFLLSLAYYPLPFGFLAWFALVRPLVIVSRLSPAAALRAGYFFGVFFSLFSLYWIALVTPPGMIAACFIVGSYYALVLVLFRLVAERSLGLAQLLLPFLWVGMEYMRTLGEFAFPWSDLGYTQSYYLYILQVVSITSVHGLSFIIAVVNVLLWRMLSADVRIEGRMTCGFVSAGLVLLLIGYGWAITPRYPVEGTLPIALLQGSVPIEVKWGEGNEKHSLHLYDSLSQSVADSNAILHVWPETAVPAYLSDEVGYQRAVGMIARDSRSTHLVGAMGLRWIEGERQYFNSCYQVDTSGQIVRRYDKMRLVPFSERVPYQDYVPILQKKVLQKYLTFIETYGVQWWSDFRPGDSLVLFELPDNTCAVAICFESTFPEFSRQAVRRGADFLVGITNDTWFKKSVGIHMHSRIFLTRMVENRSWGVRVANSGITYVVDPYGRIRDQLGIYDTAAMVSRIRPLEGWSVFTRYGDLTGQVSFLILTLTAAILLLRWIIARCFAR